MAAIVREFTALIREGAQRLVLPRQALLMPARGTSAGPGSKQEAADKQKPLEAQSQRLLYCRVSAHDGAVDREDVDWIASCIKISDAEHKR